MPRTFGRGALKRKRKLELYTEPISREFKKPSYKFHCGGREVPQ